MQKSGASWTFLRLKCIEFEKDDIEQFASRLALLNKSWDNKLSTCCETVDLKCYGIEHGGCIDANLLSKYFVHDAEFMAYWLMQGVQKIKGSANIVDALSLKI